MMFLTMNEERHNFTTKGTKFARRTQSAGELRAFLVLFVVNRFDRLAGQGMSAWRHGMVARANAAKTSNEKPEGKSERRRTVPMISNGYWSGQPDSKQC
jgi:hypothetical protein